MEDAGQYYDKDKGKLLDVIPISEDGKTDIYAFKIGLDGFHGISQNGSKIIQTYLPDVTKPGAVKDGEVELIAGVVLKDTKKAGVLRDVTVKASEAV